MKKLTTATEWTTLAVDRRELELNTVLTCGQSFRWKSTEVSGNQEWTGVFSHCAWRLRQDKANIMYQVYPKDNQNLAVEDTDQLLRNYFQLDVPLTQLYKEWKRVDPLFAKLPLEHCQGIRILKQDAIETIFAFICSANNNISRISQMVEKLCTFYGEKIIELDGKTYYDFPRVENLQGETVEAKLRAEKFGYRAGYIAKSASLIVSKGGEKWVEGLKTLEYCEAQKELQTLFGVGRKVADCVCLMGLGFNEAIPVDTHIYKLGKEYLPHLNKTKTVTDRVYTEISDHFRSIHGEYAGWAQTVLFSSKLRNFKSWFENGNSEEMKKESKSINSAKKRKRS